MTEITNFSQAWDAYVDQHGYPPNDANALQKYSKLKSNDVEEITEYSLAKLQFEFNKKVIQSAENDVCGDSDDINAELERLQKQLNIYFHCVVDYKYHH